MDRRSSPDWPSIAGGGGGLLLDQNQASGKGEAIIVGADPAVMDDYFGRYARNNVLQKVDDPQAFMKRWRPRILTDEEWMPKEDLVRSEFYNDFLQRIDVHSVMMVRLEARGLNAVNLDLGRPNAAVPTRQAISPGSGATIPT